MKKFNSLILACTACLIMGSASAQTIILSQDFEGTGMPSGWSQSTLATDGGWNYRTAASLSSSFFTFPTHTRIAGTNDDDCDCDKSNDVLKTPVLDFRGYGAVIMSFECFYGEGAYQGAQEEAYVQVSNDSGATFTNVYTIPGDADWREVRVNLSAYVGDSAVVVAFKYNDGSGWTFGMGVDDVVIFEPADYDMSVTSNDLAPYANQGIVNYIENGNITISGELFNFGGVDINKMTLNYQVGTDPVVSSVLTGLNITSQSSYNYTHPTAWVPAAAGYYTINVWASALNDSLDENTSNDVYTFEVYVADQLADRLPLVEQFTSSTCAPCATWNPVMQPILDNANANDPLTAEVAVIKWQMDYPSPGTDPAYTDDCGTRHTYYGVPGIPHTAMGHVFNEWPGGGAWTAASITNEAARKAAFDIAATATVSDSTGEVEVSVAVNTTSYIQSKSGANLRLRAVVTEQQIAHNIQTNGETEFFQVFRASMPNINGSSMGSQAPTNAENFNLSHTFADGDLLGDYALDAEYNNLRVILFVQDEASQEVFQAAVVMPTYVPKTPDATSELTQLNVRVFPNPTNGLLNISVKNASVASVEFVNALGETVHNATILNGNAQLNVSEFESGMYFVRISTENGVSIQKVRIN